MRVDELLLRGPEIGAEDADLLLLLTAVSPQGEERTERLTLRRGAESCEELKLFGILKGGQGAGRAHG